MKDTFFKNILFLLLILTVGLYLAPFRNVFEGYASYDLETPGLFPRSVDKPILDDFPLIGKNTVSNDSASEIWKDYPVFGVGPYADGSAYDQLTNNIRYNRNPDNGICSRAEFCGALYHDKKHRSNIVKPLPPAEEGPGARIGYYRSEPNDLFFSIPTNENILY